MPNFVINEVVFRNVNKDDRESILVKVLKDGVVDFSVLVPPPLNIWRGDCDKAARDAFGNNVWYEWNTNNWGTKWNALVPHVTADEEEKTLTITFKTAWQPPRLWLCALLNATQTPFQHNWLGESKSEAYTSEWFFKKDIFYSEGSSVPAWEETVADKKLFRYLRGLLREPEQDGEETAGKPELLV